MFRVTRQIKANTIYALIKRLTRLVKSAQKLNDAIHRMHPISLNFNHRDYLDLLEITESQESIGRNGGEVTAI